MSRDERYVVRCTAAEKNLLAEVAFVMQRTLSDAVRILVFEKARDLEILIPLEEAERSRESVNSLRSRSKTKIGWEGFSLE